MRQAGAISCTAPRALTLIASRLADRDLRRSHIAAPGYVTVSVGATRVAIAAVPRLPTLIYFRTADRDLCRSYMTTTPAETPAGAVQVAIGGVGPIRVGGEQPGKVRLPGHSLQPSKPRVACVGRAKPPVIQAVALATPRRKSGGTRTCATSSPSASKALSVA